VLQRESVHQLLKMKSGKKVRVGAPCSGGAAGRGGQIAIAGVLKVVRDDVRVWGAGARHDQRDRSECKRSREGRPDDEAERGQHRDE
jgi:hypothetical protein